MAAITVDYTVEMLDGEVYEAKTTQLDLMVFEQQEFYIPNRGILQARFTSYNFLRRTGVIKLTWQKFNEQCAQVVVGGIKTAEELDPTQPSQPTSD